MDSAAEFSDWVEQRVGSRVVRRQGVGGGCIHQAWRIELGDGRHLFAKTNHPDALPLLEAEAEGLQALAAAAAAAAADSGGTGTDAAPVIPLPLAAGRAGDRAVLLLPWLELERPPAAAAAWSRLGAALAELHRRSLDLPCGTGSDRRTAFGWSHDNFIGSGPQLNGWMEHWGRFFAERRLAPQLESLARRGQPLQGADALLQQVPAWLDGHPAEPCLVHGDLWSGNLSLLADGRGALFDPAVYRGDREVDLAMARLFGGVPAAFFEGYEARWPLPQGHRPRGELYNLYHLLNHANLFGGGYRHQAQECLQHLLGGRWW